MRLIFDSEEEKSNVMEVASKASTEARSQFYLHLLGTSEVEGFPPQAQEVVPEESLVDENVEQITGF